MSARICGALLAACCLALCFTPLVGAQLLYTVDGAAGLAFETPLMPGPPCGQPTNPILAWPILGLVPPSCPAGGPTLVPTIPPPAGLLGDVGVDRLTDIVYITDGFHIEEFAGGSPIGLPPGFPLNSYIVPPQLNMAGLTGLCVDGVGFVPGVPNIWITDGFLVAAISPGLPGCGPAGIVVPPFFHGLPISPNTLLTDLSWDPTTGTLWVCDTAGWIHQMGIGGGLVGPSWPVVGCGLVPPLQGIAYDLGSQAKFPFVGAQMVPAVFVTDGFMIESVDVSSGLLAPPTFYAPNPCSGTPGPSHGLAYATKGITFGAGGGNLTITSSGQSSSPGPTFWLYATGATPGSVMWVTVGANAFAPGYFCPPLMAVGQPLWVDFITPPGQLIFLGASVPGIMPIPAAIPPGLPTGAAMFVQFWEDLSGGAGGPFVSSDALGFTITLP
jgi:hypothetical protein